MSNVFPTSMTDYMQWCQRTSRELQTQTNGQVRIKPNKLAAILAKNLPSQSRGFNINTLKQRLSSTAPQKTASSATGDNSANPLFLRMAQAHMDALPPFAEAFHEALNGNASCALSEKLEEPLFNAFSQAHELSEADFLLVKKHLNNNERLNDAHTQWLEENTAERPSFAYLEYTVHGLAYRDWLQDRFELLLDAIEAESLDLAPPLSSDRKVCLAWLEKAIIRWGSCPEETPEAAQTVVAKALRSTLMPTYYSVDLRAIVKGPYDDDTHTFEPDPEWTIYDSTDNDAHVTVRLETSVTVQAETPEQAFKEAKLKAPMLNAPESATITFWVDDGPDSILPIN